MSHVREVRGEAMGKGGVWETDDGKPADEVAEEEEDDDEGDTQEELRGLEESDDRGCDRGGNGRDEGEKGEEEGRRRGGGWQLHGMRKGMRRR
jgi:hypothetical protein